MHALFVMVMSYGDLKIGVPKKMMVRARITRYHDGASWWTTSNYLQRAAFLRALSR